MAPSTRVPSTNWSLSLPFASWAYRSTANRYRKAAEGMKIVGPPVPNSACVRSEEENVEPSAQGLHARHYSTTRITYRYHYLVFLGVFLLEISERKRSKIDVTLVGLFVQDWAGQRGRAYPAAAVPPAVQYPEIRENSTTKSVVNATIECP